MAHRRPAVRACLVGAGIAIGGALLGACNITSFGESGQAEPDATDRVRATDLQPRFQKPAEGANTGSAAGPRSSSFFGSGTTLAPAAAPDPTPGSGGEGYEFNFENTPVTTVAKVILGDILGTGYTIDPRVQGTVTLTSGHPVPKNDVLFVLESALRTSNVALVRERTGYRLVPAPEAVGSAGADRSPEAGYGVTVIPLRYVSVQTVTKLLDSFAAKPGAIKADTARNLVLVQGTGAERRAALDTVLSFDGDWMRGQSVGIYPIRNTTPDPVLAELEKIVDSGEGGLNQNLVKLQAVARMNAILVVTSKPELLRTVATWINRLDNSDTASTGVKVYRVRYGDARQIARLLNDIFLGGGAGGALDSAGSQLAPGAGASGMSTFDRLTGATQSSATTPGGLPQPQQPTMAGGLGGGGGLGGQPAGSASTSPLGASASARTGLATAPGADTNSLLAGRAGGAPGAGAVLSGVRITADVVNNALLIYSNQENYRVIERAINQLDRPQLQVAIDLTIAEVTLNDKLNFGVQGLLFSANLGLPTGSGQIINTAIAQPLAQVFPGSNILVGSLANPQFVLNALHTYTDVKVLSNPSLVVMDNQVATLQVGDQVPITTGTATVLSANNAVVNTINYQNTGIILRVVPRINSNGKVSLEIEQEISNVSSASAPGSLTPTISQRRVKSSISVVTGQTVLLAGLISETQNRTRNGIPFLDQIPIIGEGVVTNNEKGLTRTELIIFIRPQIIRDSVDAAMVAEELRSRLRGGKVGQVAPPGAAETPTPQVVR